RLRRLAGTRRRGSHAAVGQVCQLREAALVVLGLRCFPCPAPIVHVESNQLAEQIGQNGYGDAGQEILDARLLAVGRLLPAGFKAVAGLVNSADRLPPWRARLFGGLPHASTSWTGFVQQSFRPGPNPWQIGRSVPRLRG